MSHDTSFDNLSPMLGEYAELVMQKKAIEARLKQLDQEVRPVLAEKNKPVVLNGYQFSCKMIAGRKSLDRAAVSEVLSKHGYDIADFEKQGAPYTQMTVKAVEEM